MALFRVFRVPRHQKYEYKPRYWDPKKEELEERITRIEEINKRGVDGAKARISGGFRKGYYGGAAATRSRNQQVRRSNIVLLVIVALLVLVSYLAITIYFPWFEATLQNKVGEF